MGPAPPVWEIEDIATLMEELVGHGFAGRESSEPHLRCVPGQSRLIRIPLWPFLLFRVQSREPNHQGAGSAARVRVAREPAERLMCRRRAPAVRCSCVSPALDCPLQLALRRDLRWPPPHGSTAARCPGDDYSETLDVRGGSSASFLINGSHDQITVEAPDLPLHKRVWAVRVQ